MPLVVVVVHAMLLLPGAALAQDLNADAADEEARSRFQAGRLAFEHRRFDEALQDFRRAYELSGRHDLLFNVARCLDRLGRDEEALEAYREYLARAATTSPGVAEARARVSLLEAPVETGTASGWSWALGIGGAVTLAAGIATWCFGLVDRATVEGAMYPTRWADVQDAYARGPVLEWIGAFATPAGAIALGFGIALALGEASGGEVVRASAVLR